MQAIKTVLNYLSETNGELHYFLHNYVSRNSAAHAAGGQDCDAIFPIIRLNINPAHQLLSLAAVQQKRLNTYAFST